jgi:DNA-binding NtrC family response regulator
VDRGFKILMVEDMESFRDVVKQQLGVLNDFDEAGSLADARVLLQKNSYEIVILDKGLPDGDGIDLISEIKQVYPNTVVIILTSDSDFTSIKKCILRGADDYVVKSPSVALDLLLRIPLVVSKAASTRKIDRLQQLVKEVTRYEILGKSPSTLELREAILSLKDSRANVLISGESGTGKELIARRINSIEDDPDRPFVAVNCGAIAESLLESELFGHKKGSFTGATQDRPGKFELADGGDLFLDEIGELPLTAQAKLLRVIQEGELSRVGDNRVLKVSVRIIAATNRSLENMIKAGQFREDLFHRLNVINLHTTPLRYRMEDIPDLVRMFVLQIGGSNFSIASDAVVVMQKYEWPGNIRELRNSIERALISTRRRGSTQISCDDLRVQKAFEPPPIGINRVTYALPESKLELTPATTKKFLDSSEREFIKHALRLCDQNVSEAAERLGISRAHIYRKIKDHNIDLNPKIQLQGILPRQHQLELGKTEGELS